MGKGMGGGVPVGAFMSSQKIMESLSHSPKLGHITTFGGNPLACAVASAALDVVIDENLSERAEKLGIIFRNEINKIIEKTDLIYKVRGKGLLNAILVNDSPESSTAWKICLKLAENGLLAKPTHGNIIRLAPPLVITEEQLMECVLIIEEVILSYSI